jgi:arylsulfatase A-like enzyme
MDDQLGRLLTEMESRGALQNTLVIITSDHGEQFGEHGLMMHTNSLYLPLLHVPLVVSLPGRLPPNRHVPEPVSLRDLPETIMDVIGTGQPGTFPGASLTRYWADNGATRGVGGNALLAETEQIQPGVYPDWYPAMQGPMKSLTLGSLHYIKNLGDGTEALYDFVADPGEERNLVDAESARRALEYFRASMEVVVSRGQLPA